MPWARLDDNFHDHPKVDGLSLAAVGLYTLCLTWAHRHRKTAALPGHVSIARVRKVAPKNALKLALELTQSGLWEDAPNTLGGYVIHDFNEYLPKERDPEERAQAGRKGALKRWEDDRKQHGNLPSVANGKPDGKPDGNLPATSMANPMANDGSRASARAFPTRTRPITTTEDLDTSTLETRDPEPAKATDTTDPPWAARLDPTPETPMTKPDVVVAKQAPPQRLRVADEPPF